MVIESKREIVMESAGHRANLVERDAFPYFGVDRINSRIIPLQEHDVVVEGKPIRLVVVKGEVLEDVMHLLRIPEGHGGHVNHRPRLPLLIQKFLPG